MKALWISGLLRTWKFVVVEFRVQGIAALQCLVGFLLGRDVKISGLIALF